MNTVKIIPPSEAISLMSDPELFERIGFCFKFGLITDGIDRKSILKGGKLLDRMRLCATRNEIERCW